MVKFRTHLLVLLAMASLVGIIILAGCSNRDERFESAPLAPSLQEADAALHRAQAAMQRANIDLELSDIGTLGHLATILPSPLQLSTLEDPEVIQEAIRAMYEVLDAVGQQQVAQAPANPAQTGPGVSESDLVLVHIHFAYLYVLEAVRITTIEGWGKDGEPNTNDDLCRISFPEEFVLEDVKALEEIYVFELTERSQAIFDAIEANPNSRSEDYLKQFNQSQRQVILDALLLLLGSEVKVPAFPSVIGSDSKPIIEQTSSADRGIYRQDALFHLQDARNIARVIAPDLEEALNDLSKIIVETFAEDFLDQISQWSFEVLNAQEVHSRLDKLVSKR